jgi:3-hydroxyisobutyrate dehydrogenase-like beta-hydroxyacid dehydrogenase
MKHVAMIGVGIMGSSIARNLARNGFRVTGYDPDPARLAQLGKDGGAPARSAGEAAREADIVLTSLPSAKALDATVGELLGQPRRGLVVAELSTLPIEEKQRQHDRLRGAGLVMLDCPLSGTGAQAVSGDLVVFASGDKAACEAAGPVFAGFARLTHHLGEFGNGSRMKFVANLLVAIHNVASAEAMVLGMKAGLDPALVAKVVASGAGTSKVFELRSPMMVAGDYRPASMKIEVWKKDMQVIGDFAKSLGVETPTFSASAPVYEAALAAGLGNDDTAAVCAVLEKRAGLKR